MFGDVNRSREGLLAIALSAAVPLRIMELEERGGPSEEDIATCQGWSDQLGEQGDVLLFGGGKKGQAAHLFNQLAKSIAILSFCPGGVRLFGEHWESESRRKEE